MSQAGRSGEQRGQDYQERINVEKNKAELGLFRDSGFDQKEEATADKLMNYVDLEEEAERQPLDLIEAHNNLTGTMIFTLALPSDRRGSHTVAEENSNHSHLQQVRVVLCTRPSDPVGVKQADTMQGVLRKALGAFEHDLRQKREKPKEHWKHIDIADMQADNLEEAGILLGEVYDEKIIGELLAQEEGSYSG